MIQRVFDGLTIKWNLVPAFGRHDILTRRVIEDVNVRVPRSRVGLGCFDNFVRKATIERPSSNVKRHFTSTVAQQRVKFLHRGQVVVAFGAAKDALEVGNDS
jgi:hypothetical protein